MDLNLHTVHFTADNKLLEFIESRCKKLNNFNDTITSVDVYLKLENTSDHIKDKVVEMKINIFHDQVFVKHSSKLFEESFSMVMDSAVTQLKKKKEMLKS